MSDLDFDEIDRAVNSVTSNTPTNSPNVSGAVEINSVPQAVLPVVVPSPPVARRSVGQFMDVVHPSSNMRRTIEVPERQPHVNIIQTQTVTPAPAIVSVEPTPPPEAESKPEPESEAEYIPEPYQRPEPVQDTPPEFTKPTVDAYEDADIEKISDDINKVVSKTTDTSLEFPFISGTKVEKRPLGAFSADSSVNPNEKVEASGQAQFAPQPSTEQKSMDAPAPSSLPAELQNDLLKIEADSTTMPENVVLPDKPAEEIAPQPETEAAEPEMTEESPRDVAEKAEPIGPTSIIQQYEEKPKTDNQKSGAIYDTESYHKTLVHPAKKKSGWLWVLYIAIFLVVGAGIGVAVYRFVIPALSSL